MISFFFILSMRFRVLVKFLLFVQILFCAFVLLAIFGLYYIALIFVCLMCHIWCILWHLNNLSRLMFVNFLIFLSQSWLLKSDYVCERVRPWTWIIWLFWTNLLIFFLFYARIWFYKCVIDAVIFFSLTNFSRVKYHTYLNFYNYLYPSFDSFGGWVCKI